MLVGTFADAFGFTPREFYRLTLPQVNALCRYLAEKGEAIESASRASTPHAAGAKSVDSLDELVAMFGSPESKQALMERP